MKSAWFTIFVLFAAIAAAPALAQDDLNEGGVVMERFHNDAAQPGAEFQIQVRISSGAGEGIKAMGLRETLPDGWTFAGMSGVTGDVPAVAPPPGSGGLLEFAWITIPQFPYTFAYSVNVPQDDPSGSKVLHGQLEYRLDAGAQYAAPVITNVAGAADTQPPTISLQGGQYIRLAVGQGFDEPGYSARDNVDGDLTSQVRVNGSVNSNSPGTYVISYTVNDRAGNTGRAERSVQVVDRNSGPGGVDSPGPSRPVGGGVGTGGGTVGDGTGGGGVGPVGGLDPGMTGGTANNGNKQQTAQATQTPSTTAAAGTSQPVKTINHPQQAGSMEMRPPIPAADAAAAAGAPMAGQPAPNQQGPRTIDHPAVSADAAQQSAGVEEEAQSKLSNEWPTLEAARAAEVTAVEAGTDANAATVEPTRFGPQTPAANIFVIVGVAALCVAGLAGSFMAARSVYGGGRRRRVAAPPKP